jgi:hypothetical protein
MRKRLIALPVIATAALLGFAGAASALDAPATKLAQMSPVTAPLSRVDVDPMPTNVIAPMPPRRVDAPRVAPRPVPAQARAVPVQAVRVVQSAQARPACQTPRCGPLMMIGVTY